MSFDSNALTLADYAMQSNDPGVRELIKAILLPTSILNDIPLITNPALKAEALRLLPTGLPGSFSGWGRVNKDPTVYKASFEDFQEPIYLVRNLIQVDVALLESPNWIGDPFEMQLSAWRDHLNYELNTTFINNDPIAGNGDAWVGLKSRFTLPHYKVPARNLIDAGGLNMKTSMADADAETLMEILGTMFAFVGSPDGTDCVIYTNYLMKERMARAFRQTKQWRYDQDAFGRMVEKFRMATVRDLGWQQDSVTPVVSLYETSAGVTSGTSTAYTSLYVVRYGNTTFRGWQRKELKLEYLGRSTETGVKENALIDWGVGILQPHPFAIARAFDIQLA